MCDMNVDQYRCLQHQCACLTLHLISTSCVETQMEPQRFPAKHAAYTTFTVLTLCKRGGVFRLDTGHNWPKSCIK